MTEYRTPWDSPPAPVLPAPLPEGAKPLTKPRGRRPQAVRQAVIEEDVFNLAIAVPPTQRNLSVEGCRILARQFRSRVEAHQVRAAALVGASRACPFDLHALLPVPQDVLQRGPCDPQALAWCRTHWGVTDRLRHVALRPGATAGRRLPRGYQVASYGFFTDGETPHAAATQLALRWASLRFVLQPLPAT